ncbi:arsenical resistance protein ArsH [Pseudoalteromonas sp.]|uniref:arsenical resistance protein ArsH n=1 Tax=Pseudoalteromonas sp. TaxID=53249 RepID=UPI0035636CFB
MHFLSNETFNLKPEIKALSTHKPKVLMLYGSLRNTSYSKLAIQTAANILEHMGAEVRIFDPKGLPVFDNDESASHSKVKELRELANWSEAQVWCSPEIHGNMSAVFKNQIDWLPLSSGAIRPSQGKVLALMQVSGGSQSFNALNNMRVLGRWMRMFTIANQSSIAKVYQEFEPSGEMKASNYRNRVVDVMEELMRFTYLLRDHDSFMVDRFSERNASKQEVAALNNTLKKHINTPEKACCH